jgi:AraC-like DNA-binding protein
MKKIEIEGLTISDLEKLLEAAVERVIAKIREEDKKPSEWEKITLEQAAQELHCSKRTIRRRMKVINMKPNRTGKEIILQRKDLKKIEAVHLS